MGFQRRSLRAVAGLAVAAVVLTGGVARSSAGPVDAKRAQAASLAAQIDAMAQRIATVAARLDAQQAALLKTEASMRALLARVNGELGALVAAEQARRDAARRARGGRPRGTWDCIRQLESGNNYSAPGGGAYQFLDPT